MSTTTRLAAALAATITLLAASPARAQLASLGAPHDTQPGRADQAPAQPDGAEAPPAQPTRFHADAEVDPTAYALSGYSLHVGLGLDRTRLDLGAFAMKLPRVFHGNEGFEASFDGFGAKVHHFFFAEQRGLFAGVDGGAVRVEVRRSGTDLSSRQTQLSLGAHVGYRIGVVEGLYVTPWIGVGRSFFAHDVSLGGSTFEMTRVTVFPAVHLGYQFR